MSMLQDHFWKSKYTTSDGNLMGLFYIPVLSCAKRYDRTSGFFCADTLSAATLGLEELVRNDGHMRLIVGHTLKEPEIQAISKGESLKDTVEASLMRYPLEDDDYRVREGLEFLAWLVAQNILEVRVAVPCRGINRMPVEGCSIFHEKSGIIEDGQGSRISFNGSLNETMMGWTQNWEAFHVFQSWKGDVNHLEADEETFQRLWEDRDDRARVVSIARVMKEKFVKYLPPNQEKPARLKGAERHTERGNGGDATIDTGKPASTSQVDVYVETWKHIRNIPDDDETTGMATAAVSPWPHQVEAFYRMYRQWPPKLLIADEVGLGKTVQAGMLIRQAWITGRAKRILVMAPPPVLRQWQLELREKFNLNAPIYESGKLSWCPSPALGEHPEEFVSDEDWHKQPFILTSSYLMRRDERRKQILEKAEPWDIVVLDEAHHARRRDAARGDETNSPNNLLRLMRGIRDKHKTQGLILLTATPMQVDPVEVWDLLGLLGLPKGWNFASFLQFYEQIEHPNPSAKSLRMMADLTKEMEAATGRRLDEKAVRLDERQEFTAKKVLEAIHAEARAPLENLRPDERNLAQRLMKTMAPTRTLISRHTRELLRRYRDEGSLQSNIAVRGVEDVPILMTTAERYIYEDVEDYISTTYNRAEKEKNRTAVGFVMTIYRRRLASSFYSLAQTLENRLARIEGQNMEENMPDDDAEDDIEVDDANAMMKAVDTEEERGEIRRLLESVKELPMNSKAEKLLSILDCLESEGYRKSIIFTQFTDTLDDLRGILVGKYGQGSVLCFSGRGGEQQTSSGWECISREATKAMFRDGQAKILLCTDAASEGLNFQYCGALINYDMPWNPMRVEQRIGRIDRLGQKFNRIRIFNLMYKDTVEADIYAALGKRIKLFDGFVGRLQPILSKLPKTIKDIVMQPRYRRDAVAAKAEAQIDNDIKTFEASSFNLDDTEDLYLDIPKQKAPAYDLAFLHGVLTDPKKKPFDCIVKPLSGGQDYSYHMPGKEEPVRVTTNPKFFEEHSESCELWSPGSPTFPWNK